MKVNCEYLWHGIPAIQLSREAVLPDGLFRISLSDFLHVWRGFPALDLAEKRERLESIFNTDYFDDYIVLTDAVSMSKLATTNFSKPSCRDGSGFIYIYTYEDNVLAGLYTQGALWWATTHYEAKLKIGRTEQHPFQRINQQLNVKVNIPEPPILLTALWTNLVVPCERKIHLELTEKGKRVTDSRGNHAKGGVEWFKDTPTQALTTISKWVEHFRVSTVTYYDSWFIRKTCGVIKKAYASDQILTLLYSEGWFVIDCLDIWAVKIRSKKHVIIRSRHNNRFVLDLSKLTVREFIQFFQPFQENFDYIRSGYIETYVRKPLQINSLEGEHLTSDV